jgi:DNA-binding transcriptional MerR regulator
MNRVDFASSFSAKMSASNPMTIGQLARQTGVSIKTLREYEHLGLIYTLGRSESNYRLFNDEALWCVQVIGSLRSLGLTLKEIQEISTFYCRRPGELAGPRLAEKLDQALSRIEARLSDLEAVRQRILDFKMTHAAALEGLTELPLYISDPRRQTLESAS